MWEFGKDRQALPRTLQLCNVYHCRLSKHFSHQCTRAAAGWGITEHTWKEQGAGKAATVCVVKHVVPCYQLPPSASHTLTTVYVGM